MNTPAQTPTGEDDSTKHLTAPDDLSAVGGVSRCFHAERCAHGMLQTGQHTDDSARLHSSPSLPTNSSNFVPAAFYTKHSEADFPAVDPARENINPPPTRHTLAQAVRSPIVFEENVGQTDARVDFTARTVGYTAFLTRTGAVFAMSLPGRAGRVNAMDALGLQGVDTPRLPIIALHMDIVGAKPQAVMGREELGGKTNYFIGNDPSQWHTNIATYGRVEYDEVYPGIDLVYYGNPTELEYDFVVAPGSDPKQIQLGFTGADSAAVTANGDLVMQVGDAELRQQRPYVYQDIDGTLQEVTGNFSLNGHQVSFEVGSYDLSRPLVIDPVMSYSTYLGGSGFDNASAIASDLNGNLYATGYTESVNFPMANPVQSYGGKGDIFVSKFDPDGATLLFSTYLGGSERDAASGLAVDATGNIYVTGNTFSSNFPIVNAFQPVFGAGFDDAFVAKIAAMGSSLAYSSYLGGGGFDRSLGGIAVNSAGEAIVTGMTSSTDFPVVNAYQPAFGGGIDDVFITKVAAAGGSLVYSTFLGGPQEEVGWDVALDPSGHPVVTGTASAGFPLVNPFQGFAGTADAFVANLSADGQSLIHSSYLGGTNADEGYSIAVAANGNIFVTGYTWSSDFPTVYPVQTNQAERDAYLTVINRAGSALLFSTYLCGNNIDAGYDVAADAAGNPIVVGQSWSSDFLVHNSMQPYGGGTSDAFVAKFSVRRKALVYSTYLGGNGDDDGNAVTIDPTGAAIVVGLTASTNFPVANAWQQTYGGAYDGFLTKVVSRS